MVIEETLPEWRDKFLSYKGLKKQLKLIYPKDGDKPPSKRLRLEETGDGEGQVTKEVIDFVRVLEDEMEKFNSFIVEKEEDSVIKWKVNVFFKKIFIFLAFNYYYHYFEMLIFFLSLEL